METPQHLPLSDDMEPAAKRRAPVIIRMDRSRDFGTVHGDRPAGDPHARVHFYQGGLPFDAAGVLLKDHPEIEQDEKKQAKVLRLLAKAEKARAQAPGDDPDGEDQDEDEDHDADEDDAPAPFTLANWAAGRTDVPWQQVTDAITRKFSKRVQDKRSALEMLIAEGVVTMGALSAKHRAIVQSD